MILRSMIPKWSGSPPILIHDADALQNSAPRRRDEGYESVSCNSSGLPWRKDFVLIPRSGGGRSNRPEPDLFRIAAGGRQLCCGRGEGKVVDGVGGGRWIGCFGWHSKNWSV